ncbi:MAG: RES domain-containing protein [Proteobacteria bacterium]|nr:RES domain-containing protein [Pseudomonadota bacterium]MBU1596546.1 RES domain-containing protein [Pseudomonadota bacterium]
MGRAKEFWLQQQERGFSNVDGYVCSDCFGDEAIKQYIIGNATEKKCDYCGKAARRPIAASADDVTDLIVRCIKTEYVPVDESGARWDSEEKAWAIATVDFSDVLSDSGLDAEPEIFDAISRAVHGNSWARPFDEISEDEALGVVWKAFKETILHKARYVFYKLKHDEPESHDPWSYPPESILESLAKHVAELELITTIPTDTTIFRVRISSSGERFQSAQDLGSPPPEKALYPNRMSPAGIPMFYGADNAKTAIIETLGDRRDDGVASIAAFKPLRPLKVLDLTKIPRPPSLFDESMSHIRRVIIFLNSFLEEFTKPVPKDKRMHIDYVPTQVVTEYFRHVFLYEGESIDGVKYPSSRDPEGISYAFFFQQVDCTEDAEKREHWWSRKPSLIMTKVYWNSITFKPKWTPLR